MLWPRIKKIILITYATSRERATFENKLSIGPSQPVKQSWLMTQSEHECPPPFGNWEERVRQGHWILQCNCSPNGVLSWCVQSQSQQTGYSLGSEGGARKGMARTAPVALSREAKSHRSSVKAEGMGPSATPSPRRVWPSMELVQPLAEGSPTKMRFIWPRDHMGEGANLPLIKCAWLWRICFAIGIISMFF